MADPDEEKYHYSYRTEVIDQRVGNYVALCLIPYTTGSSEHYPLPSPQKKITAIHLGLRWACVKTGDAVRHVLILSCSFHIQLLQPGKCVISTSRLPDPLGMKARDILPGKCVQGSHQGQASENEDREGRGRSRIDSRDEVWGLCAP